MHLCAILSCFVIFRLAHAVFVTLWQTKVAIEGVAIFNFVEHAAVTRFLSIM